jgi:hypothetical protein
MASRNKRMDEIGWYMVNDVVVEETMRIDGALAEQFRLRRHEGGILHVLF